MRIQVCTIQVTNTAWCLPQVAGLLNVIRWVEDRTGRFDDAPPLAFTHERLAGLHRLLHSGFHTAAKPRRANLCALREMPNRAPRLSTRPRREQKPQSRSDDGPTCH